MWLLRLSLMMQRYLRDRQQREQIVLMLRSQSFDQNVRPFSLWDELRLPPTLLDTPGVRCMIDFIPPKFKRFR
jgi:hypothetical protein